MGRRQKIESCYAAACQRTERTACTKMLRYRELFHRRSAASGGCKQDVKKIITGGGRWEEGRRELLLRASQRTERTNRVQEKAALPCAVPPS